MTRGRQQRHDHPKDVALHRQALILTEGYVVALYVVAAVMVVLAAVVVVVDIRVSIVC
jgi:hypothetical protein